MSEVERSFLHTNTPEYILVTSLFANYQLPKKGVLSQMQEQAKSLKALLLNWQTLQSCRIQRRCFPLNIAKFF